MFPGGIGDSVLGSEIAIGYGIAKIHTLKAGEMTLSLCQNGNWSGFGTSCTARQAEFRTLDYLRQ